MLVVGASGLVGSELCRQAGADTVGAAPKDSNNVPSVVVEEDLANETAVELTNQKKKEEESERRWFNQ